MRAAIYKKYGPPEVLHLQEWKKPTPKDHEVLVKVHTTTVTAGDVRMRKFDVPKMEWLFARLYLGVFGPRRKVLGMELAGEIEAVGKKVTRFQVGDAVFGGTFWVGLGGYGEYLCFPEDKMLAFKPEGMSFEEAAALPIGGLTALRLLKKAKLESGQSILIYGASGSVGSYAVQLAKNMGTKVTAVCSTANLEWVKDLGADEVIDYTKGDITQSKERYDVVFDAVAKLPSSKGKSLIKKGGRFIHAHETPAKGQDDEDLTYLVQLFEEGKIKVIVDRTYPLEDIVEAHRYVEQGRKKGNVVIQVASIA